MKLIKDLGTGWDLIFKLRDDGHQYTDRASFIDIEHVYSCGCSEYETTLTFKEFRDAYAYTKYLNIEYYYDEDSIDYVCVYLEITHICSNCIEKNSRVYCIDCPRPTGFESVTKYHGIAAFNSWNVKTIGDYLCRFTSINNNPDWEICCSTRPIGEIGAVIDAEVLCASNADLCSEIDSDTGHRYFDGRRYRASHLISDASELDNSVWSHDEIVTKHNKVRYVWVSYYASEEIKNYGKFIARTLKVYYVEVTNALVVK